MSTGPAYIVAQEHISDLRREAQQARIRADARRGRRIRFAVPRLWTRRARRIATI